MNSPGGRFETTSPELAARFSGSLLNELFRLADMTPQADLSAWPPNNEMPKEFIEQQAAAFMGEVARACN
jgi:hypothetical protein